MDDELKYLEKLQQHNQSNAHIMKKDQEILDAIHDLVVDIADRCPSSAEQVKLYKSLPEEIKILFEEWGGHDTVARDMAHGFLHSKFGAINQKPITI